MEKEKGEARYMEIYANVILQAIAQKIGKFRVSDLTPEDVMEAKGFFLCKLTREQAAWLIAHPNAITEKCAFKFK